MFMRRRIAIVVFVIIVYQIISVLLRSRAEKQQQFILEKELQEERDHEHSQTAEFSNVQVFPSRQFFGTDSIISGQFVHPPVEANTGMPYDVLAEFKAVWIGIDGEAEVYKLCDIYSDGKLPKLHGQYPVNVPIRRKDVKQEGNKLKFNILSGHEIKRYGSFELCIYDPAAKGNNLNDKPGRYVYSGLKTGVDDVQMYGLYMITQLPSDIDGKELSDTLHSIRLKLNNPAIAEIHFLQPDEDLALFPDDIISHPKFRFSIAGSALTFAHVVEYGSRVLTDCRIIYMPAEVTVGTSLFHFADVSPAVFFSHLYAMSAQYPSHESGTSGALSTFLFIPSQLGQLHPNEKGMLGDKADAFRRESSKLSQSVGRLEASARINGPHFVERVREWYPKVLVVDPHQLVRISDPVLGRGRSEAIYSSATTLIHPDWNDPTLLRKQRGWLW
ncbi:hypothetical protein BC943DRAFT_360016 [Umbelopsis sp. AD052]|nr:hypothetical protein BC943DRAFT_360016 [Umbelopsis sp. AD052]